MNWRKSVIYALLYISGSKIPKYLKEIKRIEKLPAEKIMEYQNEKLKKLLLHSYENVPYYQKVLAKVGVVDNGIVKLENFNKIPILTKEIIRMEKDNLFSEDYKKRKFYLNTSGGSTGEPVKFIQDKRYDEWNTATKIFYNQMLGKEMGEIELKFWGSERDIIEGNLKFKDRVINFLYNRKFFNSYNLNEENIIKLIILHEKVKPTSYWSYTDASYEFSKYLIKNDIKLNSPKFIISTINPLYDHIRETIEKAFDCPVYDQYGSREVGSVACQCNEKKELHTFSWFNLVEILNEDNKPVRPGEKGRIILTNLENYSMPLIRYDIGDIAISSGHVNCNCQRNLFSIEKILGRTLGYFKKKDGTLIHSHFIVQRFFFKDWIKRFQIIQDDYEHFTIKIEVLTKKNDASLNEIEKEIKLLTGVDIKIDFEIVEKIEPSKSGKFLYTICEVE